MPFIIIILAVLFFSCSNNQNSTTQTKEEVKVDKEHAPIIEDNACYWHINKRDTLITSLTQVGNKISGKLIFDNYEKDGSRGNVSGIAEGNILKLWYTFQSEGITSVMEVWYKKEADKLILGFGPSTQKGDSSYFTDKSKIKFSGTSMDKINCHEIQKYFIQ